MSVLLQLRELDVEDLVVFQEKPLPCLVHFREHAEDAGLAHIADSLETEADALEADVAFGITQETNESILVHINHPIFEHTQWRRLEVSQIKGLCKAAVHRMALISVLREFVAHLTADVLAARNSCAPLGAVVGLHRRLLEKSNKIGVADITLRLNLPVLDGVPTGTLVAIRRDEREHFVRFQQGLKKAITERLKSVGSERADELAKEIEQDLIESNISRIRDRLAASERALTKKASVGVFLGGLTTTCGLLCGIPPAAAVSA